MYYAQKQEDEKIRNILGENDPGFYIDVGAWNPHIDSVTKHFYDRGWRGINIEPVRSLHNEFLFDRPEDINIHGAIGSYNGTAKFRTICEGNSITGLSTLDPKNMESGCVGRNFTEDIVPIFRLETICDTFCCDKQIDFLKIDVEGYEKEVIFSGNWKLYRPKTLCIEATIPLTSIRCDAIWDGFLQAVCLYKFIEHDGLNNFYTRKEGW